MARIDASLQLRPWWWNGIERHALAEADPPERVDVAIVGIGFTGISAALTLARRGREVLLLDARDPGDGASSRNLGMAVDDLGMLFGDLVRRRKLEPAIAMAREAGEALTWLERLIEQDAIDCDYRRTGRVHLAANPAHFDLLQADLDLAAKHGVVDADLLDRAAARAEVASDSFHGGVFYPRGGGLDPHKLTEGLFDRAVKAGVTIASRCGVLGITDEGGHFDIQTELGGIRAATVVLATNAYTGRPIPGLRRRQVRVGGHAVVTEPLGHELVRQLIPRGRMAHDSRWRARFFRPTHDGQRILFAGPPRLLLESQAACAETLGDWMSEIFPQLRDVRLSHAWHGNVGLSFDRIPHIGQLGTLFYAAGYGWSGIAMALWLGHKLALKLLSDPEGASAFDSDRMPTLPFYQGTPWFLPPIMAYAAWRDRQGK